MTPASLKAGDLTAEGFLALVENLRPQSPGVVPRRIWLEAADGWAFGWWRELQHDIDWCGAGREPIAQSCEGCVARSLAGRLFASDGELRWRVIPALGLACWRTVFLGTADWVGAGLEDSSERLQGLQAKRERYYLWGQQSETTLGEWVELRIPHRFRYPIAGDPRHVRLVVELWRDEAGEPHFLRLCDLEPGTGGSDA